MNTLQVNVLFSEEDVSNVIINSLHTFWSELLDSPTIGLNDSFFHSGADSITVLKLLFRIQQQFGIRLLYKDIFENPTINLQARLIKCINSSNYHDGS
ncbi:MAG: phosphopantetheine-binding protein [Tatlockia sp.]|jgi:acyl carrier protein